MRTRATLPLLLSLLGATALLANPTPKSIRAKTDAPVLEELMGGCSMKCTFAWTVQVTDGKTTTTLKSLNDEKAATFWQATGPGIGAKFNLAFPKKIPREMEGEVPFYGFDLINGAWKTEELWRQHARLKKARLLYNGKPLLDVHFADSRRWQKITFPDIMIRSGDIFTLEVLEIYPGEKLPLALSEFVLQGAH